MSREIKFRAWDSLNKRWFRTELEWKGFSIFGELMYSGLPNMDMLPHIELQQFTGLKDKNGKEVFEGDILSVEGLAKIIIEFKEGQFVGMNTDKDHIIAETQNRNWLQWEVSGNIHENPELLK